MTTLIKGLAVATATLVTLTACGNAGDAKRQAETPNGEAASARELAARATTPQASMTPAEREEFRQSIIKLLDDSGTARAEGHVRVAGVEDQVIAMQPLQSHDFTVPMTAGKPYLVFGACDGDCSVVDLALLDSTGREIKKDTDSGDFPVLDYTPTAAGTYTVRVTMADCDLAPCYAGARVYEKS